MDYNAKNYTEQGGEHTVIGGVLEFTDDAEIRGLPVGQLIPEADEETPGGVIVGSGLSIEEDGTLSALPLAGVPLGAGLNLQEYDGKLWPMVNRKTPHVADARGNKGDVYWTLYQILQNMKLSGQMLSDA